MGQTRDNRSRQWDPVRWADQANDSFVSFARSLVQLVTWDFPPPQDGQRPSAQPPRPGARSKPPEAYGDFHRTTPFDVEARREAERRSVEDAIDPKFKDLFHDQVERRLNAVHHIRENRQYEAVPLLESLFVVEDVYEVREEIANALFKLRSSRTGRETGGERAETTRD